ncbi:lytic transglycosylase domain-containing protein [Streptomyces sp. NBC_00083]|uniref:lytic transglycosylase domain-containing protein n=1 Tax=Streptomyces sp. NBC_00083 TaxID=2975647 RepID=UPI0022595D02|nr:lytic transglycosylase domain-containing protein [Streptomyces sp. NBC_00083]MCX5383080.1 lytic transglycosylase domain-containing protein [Streptomyces sp. NBC_00083]
MAPHMGRRLRKGAGTTAVAALAVAALSASQAPGIVHASSPTDQAASDVTPSPTPDAPASGNSPYYTDLPPLTSPTPPPAASNPPVGQLPAGDQQGIPATVLDAYQKAQAALARDRPNCHLPWQLLGGIGKVESGHANGGRVDANGTTLTPILGPVLNGAGFANITDTDHGLYDGDSVHDRAVGPMQFIPSTWASSGRDGNGDGVKDPNNVYDAALAAGFYLCGHGRDVAVKADLDRAILSYNQSQEYLTTVTTWFDFYRRGTHEVPDGTGSLPGRRSDQSSGRLSTPTAPPSTPASGPSSKPGSRPTTKPTTPATPPTVPAKPPVTPTKPGGDATPTPVPRPKTLESTGAKELTAFAGGAFSGQPTVRVTSDSGKTMAHVTVKFEIVGDTDTRFAGGATTANAQTAADGTVAAPALKAGEKTGTFTVRATVVTSALPAVEWKATVVARQADGITRGDTKALTAAPGGEFADVVSLKATYKGAVASGVAATATMIETPAAGADPKAAPKVNDKGPYFKDAKNNPVREVKDLKTDAKGLLVLPKMYADGQSGTFLLRITTEGGATLTVELKVAAAS